MKSVILALYMSKHCNFMCLRNFFHFHAFCNAKKKTQKNFEILGYIPTFYDVLIELNPNEFKKLWNKPSLYRKI